LRAHSRHGRITLAGLAAAVMPVAMLAAAIPAAAAQAAGAPAARPHLPRLAAAHGRLIGAGTVRSLPVGQQRDCTGQTVAGQAQCMAVRKAVRATAALASLTPTSLRSAYGLTRAASHGGRGETVAVVSAYADPAATSDLAVYRKHFKLPACTTAKGCLRIVNEHGKTRPLPTANASWSQSEAMQLEVISALCPNCKLLLVEASSNSLTDLGIANDSAVAAGARFVVNGWAGVESTSQDIYDGYFNHPGVAIVAAAGNNGYGRTFPGDLPYVTSVGGTTLTRSSVNTRGWAEAAWADTNSGCSAVEIKPSWQRADTSPVTGCPNRTQNDVSADADPESGVAVYDSYKQSSKWIKEGETALAAAIVTAAYALAGPPAPRSYPASYPYQHIRDLNDVTFGSNGGCPDNPAYICNAAKGFDGPTGLGTPEGIGAFTDAGTDPVTLMDPGTQDAQAGTQIDFRITGLDARQGAVLRYKAVGLPRGLSVAALAHSTTALIRGHLPAIARGYTVTITGTDTRTHKAGTTRFLIVATGSMTPATPPTSTIVTDIKDRAGSECLDGGTQTAGSAVTVQLCEGYLAEIWTYLPEGGPGDPAELTTNGLCLGLAGTAPVLVTCNQSSASDGWYRRYDGLLANARTGTCLDAGQYTGPLTLQACNMALTQQQWQVQGSTLQSAIPGVCVAADDTSPNFTQTYYGPVEVEPCGQVGLDYGFAFAPTNLIWNEFGCVSSSFGGLESGSTCGGPSLEGDWIVIGAGELMDQGTGLCIGDPGGTTNAGTQLDLEPCYGGLGELWSVG
jgi:hypothetical protein